MNQIARRSNKDYIAVRDQFLTNVNNTLETLKQYWPPIITSAIESQRWLEEKRFETKLQQLTREIKESIQEEFTNTITSMKQESENVLRQVQGEATKTINEARVLSEKIEAKARSTAVGTSVEEAQKQFREAQEGLERRVKFWSYPAVVSVLAFIGVAIYFAIAGPAKGEESWAVVYHSAIRVSILTALATAAAFCLKILRAHLHMSEKNRHRQRVANSMGAFVESAATPEQRDLILSQLVESVVEFGNSGLIQREDEHFYRPKMTIDSISRTLSSHHQKRPQQ